MHGVTARDHCILLTKLFFPNISFSVMSSFIFWRNLLSLMSHKQLGKAGRTKGGGTNDVAHFWRSLRLQVTCHNWRQMQRGYVTFRGTAGAEGERSSARHPHKGLNFHKTEGKEREGVTQVGTLGGGGKK